MNVLLLGSGGREHAIKLALETSPLVKKIIWAPGNAGASNIQRRKLMLADFPAVVKMAHDENCDLICVGPEQPLCDGLADYVETYAGHLKVFGPSREAARLEGSKLFTKKIAALAGVKTASYKIATTMGTLRDALDTYPVPLKYDGLGTGKGVEVAADLDEALTFGGRVFVAKEFGPEPLLVEQFIRGREVSVFFVCNGKDATFIGHACDYKRALDSDKGKNTGGMGAYSPAAWVSSLQLVQMQGIADRIMRVMYERGTPYKGVLYLGLMITPKGEIYLLEINCRLGDPEAQVILPRLPDGVFVDLMQWSVGLGPQPEFKFKNLCTVYTVVVADGYPGSYEKGIPVTALNAAANYADVIHAGTDLNGKGEIISTGGRVVGTLGLDQTMKFAQERSLAGANCIVGNSGKRFRCRTDIAAGI